MNFNKIKLTFFFCTLLGVTGIQAQSAILPLGGEITRPEGTVSYSVGQVTYNTHVGSSGSVAEGVQQPFEISIVTGIEETSIQLDLAVYPNPTTNYLTLKVENNEFSTLNYQLFDLQGKLIADNKLTNNSTQIKMANLRRATYLLKVSNNQKTIKTFRVVKN